MHRTVRPYSIPDMNLLWLSRTVCNTAISHAIRLSYTVTECKSVYLYNASS